MMYVLKIIKEELYKCKNVKKFKFYQKKYFNFLKKLLILIFSIVIF